MAIIRSRNARLIWSSGRIEFKSAPAASLPVASIEGIIVPGSNGIERAGMISALDCEYIANAETIEPITAILRIPKVMTSRTRNPFE